MNFNVIDERKRDCGVYSITNNVNGKMYIGSAVDMYRRFLTHRSCLVNNSHANTHLQRSFNKHGASSFEFNVMIFCEEHLVLNHEQHQIDLIFGTNCYNMNPTVEVCGNNNRHIRTVTLIDPNNEEVKLTGTITSIATIVHSTLVNGPTIHTVKLSISKVLNGTQPHYRGWRLPINNKLQWDVPRQVNYFHKVWDVLLRDPNGAIHGPITNLAQFCRDHNIVNPSLIHNLIAGRTKYVNGWSMGDRDVPSSKNAKRYDIALIDHLGNSHTLYDNLSEFARLHNLTKSGLQHLIWGKQRSHRGWRMQEKQHA